MKNFIKDIFHPPIAAAQTAKEIFHQLVLDPKDQPRYLLVARFFGFVFIIAILCLWPPSLIGFAVFGISMWIFLILLTILGYLILGVKALLSRRNRE